MRALLAGVLFAFLSCVSVGAESAGDIITVAGTLGIAGGGGDGGPATEALLYNPSGVAVDASGALYIADAGNNLVRVVSPPGAIVAYAGTGVGASSGDGGPASAAELNGPSGVAIDGDNQYLYIVEYVRARAGRGAESLRTRARFATLRTPTLRANRTHR